MRYNTEIFKEKALKKHDNKYDYSLVDYINSKTKVDIVCQIHGVFSILPNKHLFDRGCPKCGREISNQKKRKNLQQIVNEFNKIHNGIYDYSQMKYINRQTKINIICEKHGLFKQTSDNHLKGKGCPICGHKRGGLNNRLKLIEFINRVKKIHEDRYTYNEVIYDNINIKIKINCLKHGYFYQTPHNHLNSRGCPICNNSKGEKLIRIWLINNQIIFEQQKKFKHCKNKKELPFDFYLPNKNTLIKYDGIQHFKPIKIFGGENEFIKIKKYDEIKNKFVEENNINLIRISYWENVENKLSMLLS